MNNKSKVFMAISKGKESTEGGFKRYIGIAPCYVKGVNPDKAEMEKLLSNTVDKDPVYVGNIDVKNNTTGVTEKIPNVRITFIVQPDPEKVNVEAAPLSISFFLQRRVRYNATGTKLQVIDKYGRTAWPTLEEFNAKATTLTKKDGTPYEANISSDYRPAYVGEEELTNFLIAYLNIPAVTRRNENDKKWYMVDNPEDSECRLDHIEDYFKGNFNELKEAIALQPTNKVKIMFGVRTDDEGKQYQAAYTSMVLRNNVSNYSKLGEDLQERKNNGAFANTDYNTCDFQEYKVESTPLKDTSTNSIDVPWV